MKKLLLFSLCLSFQLYPFADGTTDIGGDDKGINILYDIVDINDLIPADFARFDMIKG